MGSIAIAGSGSGSSGLVVGTTTITGGTAGDLLYDNSGVLGEETISVAIDVIGSAQGDILYRDAAAWKVLAPGTATWVLTTHGAGANPTWTAGGSTANIIIEVSTITGGTDKHVLFDDAGLVGEAGNFTIVSGNPNVTSSNQYSYNAMPVVQADTANVNYYFAGAGNLTATGQANFADGPGSLSALTTGDGNAAYGQTAMAGMTTGSFNMAIGQGAMKFAASGDDNLAIGKNAIGLAVSTGSDNVAIGASALTQNTSGSRNTALGSLALQSITTATDCVGIGQRAGQSNGTGLANISIGGGSGTASGGDSNNVCIGSLTLSSSGGGSNNTCIGHQVLLSASSSTNNTAIGWQTGLGLSTGNNNLILGYNEARISSGSNNISIGYQVGVNDGTLSDQLVIGNYIYGTGLSGTTTSISPGKIGFGVKVPAHELDVNGAIQANDPTAFIYAATALNNGAAGNLGTLGTAPSVGNPTKWIPINDAGVVRYIPAW